MKLFLCSHFSSVGSLIKEEIENKKVAFIPTASLREGYIGYVGSARKLFKKLGAIVTEIDISTEAYSTIQSVFENADVIYFTGGNSFFLMDQLRKTGADGLLKKELENGKLMIGESAGAKMCIRDRSNSGELWRKVEGLQDRHSPLCSCRGNQCRRTQYLSARSERKSSGCLPSFDEGGVKQCREKAQTSA